MDNRFKEGNGYYGWNTLRYVLYEYEYYLWEGTRGQLVSWEQFIRSEQKNMISIEHIYPQTPTDNYWKTHFAGLTDEDEHYYQGSLGNLLLLKQSINASLQNDSFPNKKTRTRNQDGKVVQLGYEYGSCSEREVAKEQDWTPEAIRRRGLKILSFMEQRWQFTFPEDMKEDLLFLPSEKKNL